MHTSGKGLCLILAGFCLVLVLGGIGLIHSMTVESAKPQVSTSGPPIRIVHKGQAQELERSPVCFNHDLHTSALKQGKKSDCKVCHALEEQMELKSRKKVKVYRFPKTAYKADDKDAAMTAFHNACGSCHRERASQAKKTGPDIGLCGKCHVRKARFMTVTWAWAPIFNYDRHNKHVIAAEKKCETCHHILDEKQKKLIHKKDTENSCRACHKDVTEKTARPLQKVAHAECIGCHMDLAAKGKKKVGPFECKGCHGEHKELKPDDIVKIPRLVRGQKDVLDLVLKDPKSARMKVVAFNHKSHEPRTQFCNTCHHYSLEKCSNCHTEKGDFKKGGGVSFERAFHKDGVAQSCVGCHQKSKQKKECAGCHQWMPDPLPKVSCPICHGGPSGGKPLEEAKPLPVEFDKEKVPDKLLVKSLEKQFKPAELVHQKIIKKLVTISNTNSLARTFHAAKGENAICAGCHHKMEMTAAKKVPNCTTCHGRRFDPKEMGKPGILAAYHRQCMGCHKAMNQKPQALECVKCHKDKESKIAGKLDPVRGLAR